MASALSSAVSRTSCARSRSPQVRERVAEVGREADLRGQVFGRILARPPRGSARTPRRPGRAAPVAAVGPARASRRRRDGRSARPATAARPASSRSIASALRPAAAAARPSAMFARAAATTSPAATASSRSASSFCSASSGCVGEAQLELGVGDLQLALVGVADLGAGLEVIGRDAELLGDAGASLSGAIRNTISTPSTVRVSKSRLIRSVGAISVTDPLDSVLPSPASTCPRSPFGSSTPN